MDFDLFGSADHTLTAGGLCMPTGGVKVTTDISGFIEHLDPIVW